MSTAATADPNASSENASPEGDTGPRMGLGTFALRMLAWFKPHPVRAVLILGGLLCEMAWTAIVPKSFQHMIDHALTPHNYGELVKVLIVLSIGAVTVTTIGLGRDYLFSRIANAIVNDLRLKLFRHLQALSLSFHSKKSAGDIASRFSSDIESVNQALHSCIAWGVLPALDVIMVNILLFGIDWRLALVAQLIWPLALLGPHFIAPRATTASYKYKEEEGRVLASVHETAGGRPVIKAFGLEPAMERNFVERLAALGNRGIRMGFLSSLLERSSGIGVMLLQVCVLGFGGTLVYHGSITIGALVAFESLFISMSYALFYLAQYVPTLSHSAAGLSRLDEILEEKPLVTEATSPLPLPPLTGAITLEKVVFSHDPEKRVLDGISLTIRHGESVAFVGPSGSGKSTVLNLLLRFYDPQGGSVRYDGVDLSLASRQNFVDQIATVFQESFLFNISLRENIRLGRSDATDAEVEAAARDAEIHDYILSLPKGYGTLAGERGGTMSGGQRQRIAIARALVRNPRVLFLDEATSALDPSTEVSINQTIERVGRGRTVISVTHRLSSVVNLDRIFVLDCGRLAESGSHQELLARGGTYFHLWQKQSGLHVSADGLHAKVTADRLKLIPLLHEVDDAILAELASDRLVSETVPAGRAIVVEGDSGDKFYLVARGAVAITQKQTDGTERRLAVLQDGDYFGEIALLRNVPRTASVSSLRPTTLLSLQRDHFDRLLARAPGLHAKLEAEFNARNERVTHAPFS